MSESAHHVADRVDPLAFAEAYSKTPYASRALYKTIATDRGEARVYSPLHVDMREGFRIHHETGMPLVDALRSTTAAAEEEISHKQAEREQKERESSRSSGKKARRGQSQGSSQAGAPQGCACGPISHK